jgi:hypothetical protein
MMMGQSEADHYQSLAVIREEQSAEGVKQHSSLNDSTLGNFGLGNNDEIKKHLMMAKY